MEAQPLEPIEPTETNANTPPRRSNGWDLVIYLFCGFGLFTVAGIVAGYLMEGQTNSLLFNALAFTFNLVFLGGTALLLGAARGRFSLEEIGLRPARWKWAWLGLSVGLVLLLLPLRSALGMLVENLLHGGMESLEVRTQMVLPEGATSGWISFAVTLLFVGVLVPFSEELFFRGAIYTWLRERTPVWAAVLISSMIFGLGHIDSAGVVAASFVMGVVNAWVFEKTRSIWVPILIHILNNSLAVILVYLATALVNALPVMQSLP